MYYAALASSPGEGRIYFGGVAIASCESIIGSFAEPPPQTPSLRAQRNNPESLHGKTLDCFVAPAQNCCAILSRAPRNDGGERECTLLTLRPRRRVSRDARRSPSEARGSPPSDWSSLDFRLVRTSASGSSADAPTPHSAARNR